MFATAVAVGAGVASAAAVDATTVFSVSTVEELEEALASATAEGTLQINVAPGTYEIQGPMRIWSGTTLSLDDGAVMVYTGQSNNPDFPFLRGSHFDENGGRCYETDQSCAHGGYGQCHDVTVEGGTWDRNSGSIENSNVFIFRHASGIVIRNMTLKNCSNHFINLSGSENSTVSGVVFEDAVKYTGGDADFWGKFKVGDTDRYKTIEAIHLDAATKGGEPSAWPIDGTPCRNVTVENCTFDNVFSGVGTHHVSEGSYATGIVVENCVFTSLQSFAIYCFGYEWASISGNSVNGGAGLVSVEDSSCTIAGNDVHGGNHNSIQIGNGSNAVISRNEIENSGMAAVRLLGASSAKVEGNVIDSPETMGLSAAEGSELKATGNEIYLAGQHGVYVNAATAELSKNKIVSPTQAGIRGDAKSKINAAGNTIANAGTYGITVGGGTVLKATGNAISSPAKYGIIIDSCAASVVSGNKVTAAGSVGIRLNKTNGSTVSKNTVSGTAKTCDGILLDGCKTGTVSGNKVTKTGGFGIRILGSGKASPATVAVSGNTVATGAAKSGYADIRLGDWCVKCKVTGNLLANGAYTVSSTGTSGNKYAPAATSLASALRNSGSKMTLKWKKQKYASGYQVQWADNKAFKKAKTAAIGKASKVSQAITGLAAKKRYWVRIRTFDKVSGKVCYSAWSAACTALPQWASGRFSGYAVAGGKPCLVEMEVENSGRISGTFTSGGVKTSFAVADFASWDGKRYKFKFAVKIGSKTWKPAYALAAAEGVHPAGVATIKAKNFVSQLGQRTGLLSASGKLSKLVGKSFAITPQAKNSGLDGNDSLTVSFADGDTIMWRGTVGGKAVSGESPLELKASAKKGTSVVYSAQTPLVSAKPDYARLVSFKVTRKNTGACSVKWSLSPL